MYSYIDSRHALPSIFLYSPHPYMLIFIQKHIYHWTCPECGEVEDNSIEVSIDGKVVIQGLNDGHHGHSSISEEAVEYSLFKHLGLPFYLLEQIRGKRNQRRAMLGNSGVLVNPGLELEEALARYGHKLQITIRTFRTD